MGRLVSQGKVYHRVDGSKDTCTVSQKMQGKVNAICGGDRLNQMSIEYDMTCSSG